MRHIRTRRRFRLILITLLTMSIVFFLEQKIESFAPQLKNFAELKVEDAFDKRFKLSIGHLDGGIFHPLTLNDCMIADSRGDALLPYIEIEIIVSDYRLWDILFKRKEEPRIDVKFTSKNKAITGFVRIDGKIDDAKVKGYVNLFDVERIDFTGSFKGESFEFVLSPQNGTLKVDGSISADGELEANLKSTHFKLLTYDIACDAILKNRFVPDTDDPNDQVLEGELETKNLVLNYKPFFNLKASYRISDGVLDISNLDVENNIKLYGRVILRAPYIIDITLLANNASLNRVLASFKAPEATYLSGIMNGKFEFKGPIKNPKLDARFEMRQGNLAGIDFEFLSASLRGEPPIIRIEDSKITRDSGYFVLAGEIDFSKAGNGKMFEGVKIVSGDTAILWDEWNTMKLKDVQEVRMKKKMSEELGFSFKKFVAEERIDESLRETDEYGLEYSLDSNESLKLEIGQDQDFFGLEHKSRF